MHERAKPRTERGLIERNENFVQISRATIARSRLQSSPQLAPLVKVTTKSRVAIVIRKIRDGQPRRNHAKALIKGSKLAQKRLERSVA